MACSFTITVNLRTEGPRLNENVGSPQASNELILPPQVLQEQLVELYFRYIHDTFHSLFHQPSLLEDVRHGTVPRVILLSIISLSSRFSDDPFFDGTDRRARGEPYAREAGRLLDLRDVSTQTIRASVLLGAYAITEGEAMSESIYYSVACRLAMLLDLPNVQNRKRVEQETNLRIWWTLNMIDVWSSNGVGLPRSILPRDDIPYPMEELSYLKLRRQDPEFPQSPPPRQTATSLLAQMVKLNVILSEIGQLIYSNAGDREQIQSGPREFDLAVEHLSRKLDEWYERLPPQLQDTPENLMQYNSLGLGHFFVAVYLGVRLLPDITYCR